MESRNRTSPALRGLSIASSLSEGGAETSYVRLDGPDTVRAAYGTMIQVANGWTPERADVIVMSGGGYTRRDAPGIWAEIARGTLPNALATARRPGLTLASLCTGALVLGAAEVLCGRPCTTRHGAVADLKAQGGLLKNARVVDDGDRSPLAASPAAWNWDCGS